MSSYNIPDLGWEKILSILILIVTGIGCSWLIWGFWGVYSGGGPSPSNINIQGEIPIGETQATVSVECGLQTSYPTPSDALYDCGRVHLAQSFQAKASGSLEYSNYSNHVIVVQWEETNSGRQFYENVTLTDTETGKESGLVSEIVRDGFIINTPPKEGKYELSITVEPMLANSPSTRIADDVDEPVIVYSEREATTYEYQQITLPFQALGALVALLAAGQLSLRLWDRAEERQN